VVAIKKTLARTTDTESSHGAKTLQRCTWLAIMAPKSKKSNEDTMDHTNCRFLRRSRRAQSCLGVVLLLSAWACGSSSGSPTTNASSGDASGRGGSGSDGGGSANNSGDGSAAGASGTGGSGAASQTSSGTGSDAAGAPDGSQTSGGGGCTRDGLTAAINAYYAALAAHDPTKAPLASSAKYTENGMQVQVGNGEWKTAGAVKFKRSALDTQICESVTESVIPDSGSDIVYGLRLKLVNQQITEIETIPVHSGQYIIISAQGLASSSSDDWETVLPAAQRSTRDQLQALMDTYFTRFPNGACNFASDCLRMEDGSSAAGSCTGSGVGCTDGGSGMATMTARLHVIDVEAGISVGFTMFAGMYTDFHMFKVRGGLVHGVHAVLASASSSGWN
jgi:hypothetical protein